MIDLKRKLVLQMENFSPSLQMSSQFGDVHSFTHTHSPAGDELGNPGDESVGEQRNAGEAQRGGGGGPEAEAIAQRRQGARQRQREAHKPVAVIARSKGGRRGTRGMRYPEAEEELRRRLLLLGALLRGRKWRGRRCGGVVLLEEGKRRRSSRRAPHACVRGVWGATITTHSLRFYIPPIDAGLAWPGRLLLWQVRGDEEGREKRATLGARARARHKRDGHGWMDGSVQKKGRPRHCVELVKIRSRLVAPPISPIQQNKIGRAHVCVG